jgi:hypothetical protein
MIKLIGFGLKKISGKKNKEIEKELNIKSNVEIEEIKKQEIKLIKEGETFEFKFKFKIEYEPGYGLIEFEGVLLILIEDKKLAEELVKAWKEKMIPEDFKIVLMNLIFSKCYLKSLQIEEDLNLPYHIPIPKFSKEKE